MPKLSQDSAPNVQDFGPAVDRGGDLDDITVNFVTITESHSLAPLLRGLPGDSCQCPHWGYLLAGKITVSYADREETYQAGDAFYMTPGHVPAAEAGTEFVQFSPKEQLAETLAVITANAQRAMQGQGVPDRALLTIGRHHVHVAQLVESGGEGVESRRVHPVVVGDQDHCRHGCSPPCEQKRWQIRESAIVAHCEIGRGDWI